MRLWSNLSFAALLLGSSVATSVLAATPYTGCPAGYHRAESESGGVGSVNNQTRKAGEGGGGVGSVNLQTRKAEGEGGGGVGSENLQTRKAESEGGGVGSVNLQTRRAEAMADMPCVQNSR